MQVYPLQNDGGALQQMMDSIFAGVPGMISILLLFALLPAVIEELTFRGFIMNGLKESSDRWTAVLVASLFFGATHGILQQSIIAFFTGTVIGFVAYQSGSILPAICYQFTHNAITVKLPQVTAAKLQNHTLAGYLFQTGNAGQVSYTLSAYFILMAIGIGIFAWFYQLNKTAATGAPCSEPVLHSNEVPVSSGPASPSQPVEFCLPRMASPPDR